MGIKSTIKSFQSIKIHFKERKGELEEANVIVKLIAKDMREVKSLIGNTIPC